ITGTITADLGSITLGSVTLTDTHLALVETGFHLTGTAQINGLPPIAVSGQITDQNNWPPNATATATAWTPVPALTVNPALPGALSSVNGVVSFSLTADATTPIALTPQVSIGDDLAITVNGDGTNVTATGHATVTFSVAGHPQAVQADLDLRA